jgi:Cu(I)/Ag(I) efflux system protein CusF
MSFAQTTDMTGMAHGAIYHGDDMPMDEAMIDGAIHVRAAINSFGDGTVIVSHDPIPEI